MRLIDADTLMPNAEYKGSYDFVSAYDIANAPTIDPVKHGRWETEIKTNRDGTRSFVYACSLCGNMALDVFKYCPNCGGRNEVDENDCY